MGSWNRYWYLENLRLLFDDSGLSVSGCAFAGWWVFQHIISIILLYCGIYISAFSPIFALFLFSPFSPFPPFPFYDMLFLFLKKKEHWQLYSLAYNSIEWCCWWKPHPSAQEWHGCHSKNRNKYLLLIRLSILSFGIENLSETQN